MYNILSTDLGADNKVSAIWEITDKCNLKCIHCYQGDKNNCYNLDLDVRQAARTLEELHKVGVNHIHLLGGEPLLYKDLIDVIRVARSQYGFSVSINTNGTTLSADYFERLAIVGTGNITVSIEGATPNTNDTIRGTGTFSIIDANIKACIKRKQDKKIQAQLGITVTLMNTNAAEIPLLIKYCLDNKLDSLRFVLAYDYGNYLINKESIGRDDTKILCFFDEGLKLYQNEIRKAHLAIITDFRLLPIEYFNRKYGELIHADRGGLLCNGGKTYCVVDVKGNLLPCIATSKLNHNMHWKISDMKESHDYVTAFKSQTYRKVNLLPCSKCNYWGDYCEPCPALLDSSAEIKQCEWAAQNIFKRNENIRKQKLFFLDGFKLNEHNGEAVIERDDEQISINPTVLSFIKSLISQKTTVEEQLNLEPYVDFDDTDKDLLVEAIDILSSRNIVKWEE